MAKSPTQPQGSPESFKMQQFGGMLPAWDSHLLPDGQADFSQNSYLFSGSLTGWRTPKLLFNFLNGAATEVAYALPNWSQSIATATIVFINGDQPLDGDNITLGEEVYTFRAELSGVSYE